MKLTFFLYSKDIVFENLWLYKAEDHKHDIKLIFWKEWNRGSMPQRRGSMNYLKYIVCVVFLHAGFKCKISRLWGLACVKGKARAEKFPHPKVRTDGDVEVDGRRQWCSEGRTTNSLPEGNKHTRPQLLPPT